MERKELLQIRVPSLADDHNSLVSGPLRINDQWPGSYMRGMMALSLADGFKNWMKKARANGWEVPPGLDFLCDEMRRCQVQIHFPSAPFGPLFSGALGPEDEDCLFYYDSPLMFLCRGNDGEPWLANTFDIDDDTDETTMLVVPLSDVQEQALREMTPETDMQVLSEVYSGPGRGWKVVEDFDGSHKRAVAATEEDLARARPDQC